MLRNHVVVGALTLLLAPASYASVDAVRLQHRVEQLEQVVDQLQQRLKMLEATRPVSAAEVTPALMVSQPPKGESAPLTGDTPKPANTGITAGPIKINGEFRLFFDSITRHAGGDAPRVSNIRGRYLLHLDFDAAMRRTLSIHTRLSTSPLTNPLTDIQDFGGGVAKHPLVLSEAYVDYHPNQFVRLQGGRVDSPFNDRSRFLFDIDTRFNGTTEFF